MSPQRIQLRRTRGWRKPDGAVVVARPTVWGNDYTVHRGTDGLWHVTDRRALCPPEPAEQVAYASRREAARAAVELFARDLGPATPTSLAELTGRDLCCWCPLVDEDGAAVPCHADVLLALSNGSMVSTP